VGVKILNADYFKDQNGNPVVTTDNDDPGGNIEPLFLPKIVEESLATTVLLNILPSLSFMLRFFILGGLLINVVALSHK
jgi:hypothetical protein